MGRDVAGLCSCAVNSYSNYIHEVGAKIRQRSKFAPTFPPMGAMAARDEEEGSGLEGGKTE